MMKTAKACFVRSAKKLESHCKELEVHGSQSPSLTGRRHWKKMKACSQSDIHVQACQASMLAERAAREGTIMQQNCSKLQMKRK